VKNPHEVGIAELVNSEDKKKTGEQDEGKAKPFRFIVLLYTEHIPDCPEAVEQDEANEYNNRINPQRYVTVYFCRGHPHIGKQIRNTYEYRQGLFPVACVVVYKPGNETVKGKIKNAFDEQACGIGRLIVQYKANRRNYKKKEHEDAESSENEVYTLTVFMKPDKEAHHSHGQGDTGG